MRQSTLALALMGTLLLMGCSKLVLLNPFVTEKEATLDPALLGIWHDKDDSETYVITRSGNHYAITYLDKSPSAIKFDAWVLETGDAKLLDLISKNEEPFQIPAHTPMRVWYDGATLRMSFLDSPWLRQQALSQLPAQTQDDRTIITAPTDAARKFLLQYGLDARAYGEPQVLQKEP
jgi:hypothetical protein